MKFAAASRILLITATAISGYLGSYIATRETHTKWWFDKSTEEKGAYTFFDRWSWTDRFLVTIYRPMLSMDQIATKRPWVFDKW